MKKIVFVSVLVCGLALSLGAQETPRAEIFGGYQFAHSNIEGTGLNFNGWDASVTGNVNKWFGVTGDFSGSYKSENGASLDIYTYGGGPVISMSHEGTVNPFVHVLFGGAHITASATGIGSAGSNGYTIMAGGGADIKLSPRFAWRGQADWVYYHFEGVGESKNVRVATGLVVRF